MFWFFVSRVDFIEFNFFNCRLCLIFCLCTAIFCFWSHIIEHFIVVIFCLLIIYWFYLFFTCSLLWINIWAITPIVWGFFVIFYANNIFIFKVFFFLMIRNLIIIKCIFFVRVGLFTWWRISINNISRQLQALSRLIKNGWPTKCIV